MNCSEYERHLIKSLTEGVSAEEAEAMRLHEQNCADCAAKHTGAMTVDEDLAAAAEDVPPMPEDLHDAWMAKVKESNMEKDSKISRKAWTRLLSAAAALVFVIGGTLLTRDELSGFSKTAPEIAYEESATFDSAPREAVYLTSNDTAAVRTAGAPMMKSAPTEQKIIRTVTLTMGSRVYDETIGKIRNGCDTAGGWVAYSSESANDNGLRNASLTLRIPAEQLDAYLVQISGSGRIIFREEMANDVTEMYQDTQAQLDAQLALMDRLMTLMASATELSDLLALEVQISDTQFTIDMLRSNLEDTDQQVAYATVYVNLREESSADTLQDQQISLGERLSNALTEGGKALVAFAADSVVFLTAALPFIAIVAVIAAVIRGTRRMLKRFRK